MTVKNANLNILSFFLVSGAIGGSLGLAMGCSLVSFIEFFVFAIRALYLYIRGDNAVIEPDDDDDEDDARNKKNDIRQTEIGYIRKGILFFSMLG